MGYRGKVEQQARARELRAQNMTLLDIATELGVSKSSVSLWVRDVLFTPSKRRHGPHRRPHAQQVAKLRQIEELDAAGRERIGRLDETTFLIAGLALYAGEGAKRAGSVAFANSDPAMIRLHCAWLRRFFEIDERRLRLRVYLHQGLDLDAAEGFWADLTSIPRAQFHVAYRAVADPSIRRNKHENGCATVIYSCTKTHREIMGMVRALLSSSAIPG
jgi:transcriptional regulator with XRE-family HTH domain